MNISHKPTFVRIHHFIGKGNGTNSHADFIVVWHKQVRTISPSVTGLTFDKSFVLPQTYLSKDKLIQRPKL